MNEEIKKYIDEILKGGKEARKAERKAEREAEKAEIEEKKAENARAIENGTMKAGDFMIVSGKLYKFGSVTNDDGSRHLIYEPWSYAGLTKDRYQCAPEFIRFRCIPSNTNYKQVIDEEFNTYARITHVPKKGDWLNIERLLKHIFGEQYGLALDYFRILWKHPTQRLPILLLVSEAEMTGKTTFLNFLADVFQGNFTLNNSDHFDSSFNADWVDKLIVGVDEAILDRKEVGERIKNISTSRGYKKESKGVNREEVNIFTKFVFCSNNEDNPVTISKEEVRYWVRKVPVLTEDISDFDKKLRSEIPAFLDFLNTTAISTKKTGRMWFSPKDLETAALRNIKGNGKGKNERILADMINDILNDLGVDKIKATPKDLADLCKFANYSAKMEYSDIKEVLKKSWKLEAEKNSLTYDKIQWNNEFVTCKAVGRYYTITRELITY